jgi:hypothetical protein
MTEKLAYKHNWLFWPIMAVLVMLILLVAGNVFYTASGGENSTTAFRERVRAQLRDPGSSSFENEHVFPQADGTYAYCAKMNAKNGFGGMTGYKRVIAQGALIMTEDSTPVAFFNETWNMVCRTS